MGVWVCEWKCWSRVEAAEWNCTIEMERKLREERVIYEKNTDQLLQQSAVRSSERELEQSAGQEGGS